MRVEERKVGMGKESGNKDQFPVGMRVLAVDDDPTCLKILEAMLLRCQYQVTTTNQAITALKLLRENKDKFDLVISDVQMPDMDGFKLLELVGLEMDLPVIMLSVNGETKNVMKGITHGACDYLLKPVRLEELKNIWQHVVRRKFSHHERTRLDVYEECDKPPSTDLEYGLGQITGGLSDQIGKFNRKRKDQDSEEDDEGDDNAPENEDPSAQKKPRVVWSVELHRKFVAAVNQLGIDKAVPKRILELMNVDKLTRENVASHLQKYRLYLKRLSAVASQQARIVAAFGNRDPSYLRMGSFEGLHNYHSLASSVHLPALAPLQSHGMPSRTNASVLGLQSFTPSRTIQTVSSNSIINHSTGDSSKFRVVSMEDNRDGNLMQFSNPAMRDQLQHKWTRDGMNDLPIEFSDRLFQDATDNQLLSREIQECKESKYGIQSSIRTPFISTEYLQGSVGVSSNVLDSNTCNGRKSSTASPARFSDNSLPIGGPFQSKGINKMQASFSVVSPRESNSVGMSSGKMLLGCTNEPLPARDMYAPVSDMKFGATSLGGSILILPSATENGSKQLNFGGASNSGMGLDQQNSRDELDEKLLWSSLPSFPLCNDIAIERATIDQRFSSAGLDQNDASRIGQDYVSARGLMPYSKISASTSDNHPSHNNVNVLGLSKLQGGLLPNGCNFDGLLNSIIKSEKDNNSFADEDMGCDLFPLGACI